MGWMGIGRARLVALMGCLAVGPATAGTAEGRPWAPAPSAADGAAFVLDRKDIAQRLEAAPRESLRRATRDAVRVSIPRPDGTLERFELVESPVMEPRLAARHPEIQTYAGRAVDDPARTVRLDIGPLGLNATVIGAGEIHEVAPARLGGDRHVARFVEQPPAGTQLPDEVLGESRTAAAPKAPAASGGLVGLRIYRLAMVSDPTYAETVRDQSAPAGKGYRTTAAKVAMVNRLNAIFERDWAARLVLIDDTDKLNLDTPALATQPGGACGDDPCFAPSQLASCSSSLLNRNTEIAGLLVGARNYDVGHIVMSVNTGGVARLESVGGPYKAAGCSGNAARSVTRYWLAMIVAHELGHQFGARHTYSACRSTGQNGTAGVEPGSGVTIMGYPGLCAWDNVQADREQYFSQHSVAQFRATATQDRSPLSSAQHIAFRDFGPGDHYRLTYGGNASSRIRLEDHTAAGVKAAIEGIAGWPDGAEVNVTWADDDHLLIEFAGTLAGVEPEMLGATDVKGTELIIGERVAGGPQTHGGRLVTTSNHHPVVSVPTGVVIPARTPFQLTAAASDSDGDPLTFMWEQMDGSENGSSSFDNENRTRGPLFTPFGLQSHQPPPTVMYPETDETVLVGHPSDSPTRSFPDLAQLVLDNTNAQTGTCPSLGTAQRRTECRAELLPSASYIGTRGDRTMKFRATVRDNRAGASGTAIADTTVLVDHTAGPFRVTSPAPATSTPVVPGSWLTVSWDPGGTENLSPWVNIRFSPNGGRDFYDLARDTPNDGSQSVYIPDVLTWRGVIKVEDVTSTWFDVAHTLIETSPNNAPNAVADSSTLAEDTRKPLNLLANDADGDGDELSAVVATLPAHGTLSRTASGDLAYTPDTDYHGPDSFTYKATDSALTSSAATVSLTVTPTPDAPAARPDEYSMDEDDVLLGGVPGVLSNDHDADGDAMTAALVDPPAHGQVTVDADGSFTYEPAADYHGPDSFTYRAHDATSGSRPARVRITVNPIADAPVSAGDEYATPEDTPLEVAAPGVLGNDSDADADALTATLADGPAHGTLDLAADGSLRYVPDPDFHGGDSFTYTASDGTTASAPVPVTIEVEPVNDAPAASDDARATDEDTPLDVDVLANDSDADGDALTAAVASPPAHGQVEGGPGGTLRYVPAADFHGTDTFTYTASDGTASSAPATVTVTVRPVNDRPVARDDALATTKNTPLDVAAPGVLGNDLDPDGDPLAAAVATAPEHGSLVLGPDGGLRYEPARGFRGFDTFTYTATDGTAASAPGTVAVFVGPRCTPPGKVKLRIPKPKGRVLRTVVRVGRKKVKVRKRTAVVRLREPGSKVRVKIRQRVKRKGKVRTVRKKRVYRVCPD